MSHRPPLSQSGGKSSLVLLGEELCDLFNSHLGEIVQTVITCILYILAMRSSPEYVSTLLCGKSSRSAGFARQETIILEGKL